MSVDYPKTVVQVFCKAPVVGRVKTRLTPTLTAVDAAEIHKALSLHTLDWLKKSALCDIQIWCTPDTEHPFFQRLVDNKAFICLKTQRGDDLGTRMHDAFAQGLKDYQQVILIGCDCPSLNIEVLKQAINHLQNSAEMVLSPAEDGGYVLIGLTKNRRELFEAIPWGTDNVLALTRQRINALKLHCVELEQQWDVDYPEDLARLNACFSQIQLPLTAKNISSSPAKSMI